MTSAKRIYFLGIGGIGMSALARYFMHKGLSVAGYDKTPTALTRQLEAEGMVVVYNDALEALPETMRTSEGTLVVITPAVPTHHPQWQYFIREGFTIQKRAQVLGAISQQSRMLAVAGTHGKTTTSTLLAHLLHHAGRSINAFLGGISVNYNTNLLIGDERVVVAEADEYDRSFLTLSPQQAVITSVDADHLDVYGSHQRMLLAFADFASLVQPGGSLFYKKGIVLNSILATDVKTYTYSIEEDADCVGRDVRISHGHYVATFHTPWGILENIRLGLPGRHNVENALAAASMALCFGLSLDQVKAGLETFAGVRRRFERRVEGERLVYIDDYAHHPTELSACIQSVRELYPGRRITGIFQPHLFSRTRDFASGFMQSLDELDECILLPIYPAREEPIAGIDSAMLGAGMHHARVRYAHLNDAVEALPENLEGVLLTLGAGDIDTLVEPLTRRCQ
jgi:UDP-N-acetylmuramate--alanine ligase